MKRAFNVSIILTVVGAAGLAGANSDWECFYAVLFLSGVLTLVALGMAKAEELKNNSKNNN